MVASKVRYHITQWLIMIIPVFILLFSGVITYSVAQMNKAIDSKVSSVRMDEVCKTIDKKANNETIIKMLEILKQKDAFLDKENERQNIRIDRQENIQRQQLEVMQQIKIEMVEMNGKLSK